MQKVDEHPDQREDQPKEFLVRHLHHLRSPLLSLGCGAGTDELHMARHGLEVLATDRDVVKVRTVQNRAVQKGIHRIQTLRFDILSDPLPERSFLSIYSAFLLHLLPMGVSRNVFLPKVRQLLAIDGVAMVICRQVRPDRLGHRFSFERITGQEFRIIDSITHRATQVSLLDRLTLKGMLEQHFEIIHMEEYIEPRYNKLAEDEASEIIAAILRPGSNQTFVSIGS